MTLTLIAMLDAVINPMWPWIFVGEKPGEAAFLGGAIIVGAVLISVFGRKLYNSRTAAAGVNAVENPA